MPPIRIAIIGLGKIAHDQHLPAIADAPAFALTAIVDPAPMKVAAVPAFASLDALVADGPRVDAVSICTPPQVRHKNAAAALAHGLHVLLEKPPGATLSEVATLDEEATRRGSTLFASWHSRYAPAVEPARTWLADRRIDRVSVIWREDVRVWHPNQAWIWAAGGLGVFDPGINALSILTRILPNPLFVEKAMLFVPANCAAPIAADLDLRDVQGTPVAVNLDFRQEGPQSWDIHVDTDAGRLTLAEGGKVLALPTGAQRLAAFEYPALYAHFADLVRTGRRDVDVTPLRLVADAFLRGDRRAVEPFNG
jgi:D-galactose 1-dehydrogenase